MFVHKKRIKIPNDLPAQNTGRKGGRDGKSGICPIHIPPFLKYCLLIYLYDQLLKTGNVLHLTVLAVSHVFKQFRVVLDPVFVIVILDSRLDRLLRQHGTVKLVGRKPVECLDNGLV